jgi:hypothetical protein
MSLATTPAPFSTNRALQICRIVSIPFHWQSGATDKMWTASTATAATPTSNLNISVEM